MELRTLRKQNDNICHTTAWVRHIFGHFLSSMNQASMWFKDFMKDDNNNSKKIYLRLTGAPSISQDLKWELGREKSDRGTGSHLHMGPPPAERKVKVLREPGGRWKGLHMLLPDLSYVDWPQNILSCWVSQNYQPFVNTDKSLWPILSW